MDLDHKITLSIVAFALLAVALGLPGLRRIFRRAVTVESSQPFGRVVKRLGISPETADCSERQLAIAASRCGTCEVESECRSWLAASETTKAPPTFCPNKALLCELQSVPRDDATRI